ncbi:hypothetical protein BYT27DRAFT_7225522 [Phlegmacium glaucopus]|nr:hypothetical protein BYT27DRAFT_7225522 [Phlegmacium glaucopus]
MPPRTHRPTFNNPFQPRVWPGVSPASTVMLQNVLSDNHKRWHVFFNLQGFHNHSAHSALTLWCLGANESILQAAYTRSSEYQRPLLLSPNNITRATWRNHVRDERYYQAYLDFFVEEVKVKSFDAIIEEYIFAPDANYVAGNVTQPEMLNRFFEGLLHPMIHVGFGVEFDLPGVFAEGLAQTAVHRALSSGVFPPSFFQPPTNGVLPQISVNEDSDSHAFNILARVLADARFIMTNQPDKYAKKVTFYDDAWKRYGTAILEYVDQWARSGDIHKKVEELLWTNVLIYGVGGYQKSGRFNADFFNMHLVTSSLFLPSLFSVVNPSSQLLLLRGYFAVCLAWYISRGRPPLDVARFFGDDATLHPTSPDPKPTPHQDSCPSPSSIHAGTPNPWLQIIQSALAHPDDHLPKLQRALSEYASHFDTTPAGYFKGTELQDADLIDGTLFLRVAGLTAERMGWVREGEPPSQDGWDRHGFYNSC